MRILRRVGFLAGMLACCALVFLVSGCATGRKDPYFMKTKTTANVYVRQLPPELRKVAVMPFKAPTELIGASVSDLFVTEILRTRYYTPVSYTHLTLPTKRIV